jgi:hypothetical protein
MRRSLDNLVDSADWRTDRIRPEKLTKDSEEVKGPTAETASCQGSVVPASGSAESRSHRPVSARSAVHRHVICGSLPKETTSQTQISIVRTSGSGGGAGRGMARTSASSARSTGSMMPDYRHSQACMQQYTRSHIAHAQVVLPRDR